MSARMNMLVPTRPDLVVIGSHGFRAIDHLLGTTAAKVVNRADRNVFVVRTLL